MDKQIITDIFLTKEAFAQHARQLREETAKKHGLTLEEWDHYVATGQVVTPTSGSSFHGEF
jgi:DNA-binding transcriptional MocR family regulator